MLVPEGQSKANRFFSDSPPRCLCGQTDHSDPERGPVGEPVAGDTMSGNVDDPEIGQRFRLEASFRCFLAEKQSASIREHLTCLENFIASLRMS